MATFGGIAIDEPGTIDKVAATVRIDRGGLVEQEIIVIGEGESSLAVARVHDSAPDSTMYGLVIRQVGYVAPTTGTFSISSIAGRTFVEQNSTVWVAQVSSVAGILKNQLVDRDQSTQVAAVLNADPVSTTYGLVVRPVGGSTQVSLSLSTQLPLALSTGGGLKVAIVQDDVGSAVDVDDNAVTGGQSSIALVIAQNYVFQGSTNWTRWDGLARQSTFGDLVVKAADISTGTPSAGSTGLVVRLPAPISDSTNNALRVNVVAGAAGGSTEVTVRQSTYTDLNTLSRLADRDQSTQVAAVLNAAPASTVWALAVREVAQSTGTFAISSIAGRTMVDQNSTTWVTQCSSLAGRVEIGDYSTATAPTAGSSGLIVRLPAPISDSTNNALRVNVVAGAAGGSTEVTVRQSTYTDFNTLSRLADRDQSTQVAAVLNAAPASTVWALAVREVAQSTGTFAISSIAGRTMVDQNSTTWITQCSSLGGVVAVQQNSTTWQTQAAIRDSSGTGFVGTTTRPSTGAQGLVVRTVLNDLLSTCFSTMGNNSTSSTVVSSAASVRHKVFAYSITSTVQAVNTLSFASSLANPIWQVQMQSISSGISGANLAVTPPAWLFATESASPLVFKITGSTGTYHLSFSYFSEA